jgi:hypothetical protein
MTNRTIAHQRLLNQRLARPTGDRPQEVVAWLGAVQAQDYAGAKWSLGLRLQGATDQDVERGFTEGEILRTHVLRPTWHFVTPADIRWLLALTAPRVHAANGTMYRKLGLDAAVFRRSNAALAKALRGGQQLTRDELRGVLHKAGVVADGQLRMAYLLMGAELDGVVCSGARRGKQFTYALLDDRAPKGACLEGEAALAELARRYVRSRGPATVQDFAKWSGLTLATARAGLAAIKDELETAVVAGQTYWRPAERHCAGDVAPAAYLLSIYDEFMSGYKDHSAAVDARAAARLRALGNDLTGILVLDGQVVGTWKRTITKRTLVIKASPFTRLTKARERAVAMAAEKYGAFFGLPVTLT